MVTASTPTPLPPKLDALLSTNFRRDRLRRLVLSSLFAVGGLVVIIYNLGTYDAEFFGAIGTVLSLGGFAFFYRAWRDRDQERLSFVSSGAFTNVRIVGRQGWNLVLSDPAGKEVWVLFDGPGHLDQAKARALLEELKQLNPNATMP